jgi:hypothetical protein
MTKDRISVLYHLLVGCVVIAALLYSTFANAQCLGTNRHKAGIKLDTRASLDTSHTNAADPRIHCAL